MNQNAKLVKRVVQKVIHMRFHESESNTIELKVDIPRNDQIIKTIIGFCNLHGGKLIIGVSDDRTIRGLSENDIEIAMETIQSSIFDACSPHIIPRLYTQRYGDKAILVVEVSEGMNKPYFRRSEGMEKGTYIRLGRHTIRANEEIIQELKLQTRGIDFESLPVYQATLDDLDDSKINSFLKNRRNHGISKLDEHVMKSYNLLAYDQSKKYPSVLAILLFGRNSQLFFSEAMIICTHFQGVTGREVVATVDCEGTLFNQFNQAFSFITSRLSKSFTIKALKRDEKLEIPPVAIREALLNAIVHRNYHIKAPTKIAIYDDRIEIFSPGQFPGPIRTDNLKAGITYLRNPMICKILREANYIEKLGSGFIAIFDSYQEHGLKSPQVIEGENYIKCILPRELLNEKATKLLSNEEKILDLLSINHEITVKDVIQNILISKTSAIRHLNKLIHEGVIEKIGQTKSTRYRLCQ